MSIMAGSTMEAAAERARPDQTDSGPRRAGLPDRSRLYAAWLLALIVSVSAAATLLALRHTSTTFDEIVLIAGGARGYEIGRFDLAPEHPPLMQYVYGLPAYLASPAYPDETGVTPDVIREMGYRYRYARHFFFGVGNDPERLALLGRLPAVGFLILLVLLTYGFLRARHGVGAALVAAALVGFLPDVLAHGGVAYNDVPLAASLLASLWAIDIAIRRPSPRAGALAGVLTAFTLCVKFSAIALLPMAALLIVCEAAGRRGDGAWWRGLGVALPLAIIVTYLTLVASYRGDFLLSEFRYGLDFTFRHVSQGHGAPGYLLGQTSPTGWWYFFPVAFLFKTPAAFHALVLVALVGSVGALRAGPRAWLASPLRAPLVGSLVFGYALMGSSLVIGFRYALPVLPLICIVVSVGVVQVWRRSRPLVRGAIVGLVVWSAASSLSYYPWFLSYVSEYGPGRDQEHEVLLDSSVDWGQGLLALRDYMRAHEIDRVYLSYFGSSSPGGYGIDFEPLASFFPLTPQESSAPDQATHAVISATNLHGVYLAGDPFARFRDVRPDTVLARSLMVYRLK